MSQSNTCIEANEPLVRDAQGEYRPASADEVLKAARQVIGQKFRRGTSLSSPNVACDLLRTKIGELEHEVFVALLADSQNRLIEYVEISRGLWRRRACTRERL